MADDSGRLNQVFAETSFLYGANAGFIEELHGKWATDPASVGPGWRAFFDSLRDDAGHVREAAAAGGWGRPIQTERDDQLSALDGLWPDTKAAVEAKAEAGLRAARPGVSADELR